MTKAETSRKKNASPALPPEEQAPKKSLFGIRLVIYAWLLLILFGCALVFLVRYLAVYELSQPKYCVEAYWNEFLEDPYPAEAQAAVADLDPLICSPEEAEAVIRPLLADSRLVKDPTRSVDDELLVYQIVGADKTRLGEVCFSVTGTRQFGLPIWEKTAASFDFHSYYATTQCVVPADYQVYLGNKLLGPECIVESGIPYQALEECYLHYENLPTMVRYEGGPFLGDVKLRICDPGGRELSEEELTESVFLDNCPAAEREAVVAFVDEFLPLYVFYSADVNRSAIHYYTQVYALSVPGSELRTRLSQALGSFGYSNTKALTIQSVDWNAVTDFGGGRYLADVSYTSDITGLHGQVSSTDHVRIVILFYDGRLLADALYHY